MVELESGVKEAVVKHVLRMFDDIGDVRVCGLVNEMLLTVLRFKVENYGEVDAKLFEDMRYLRFHLIQLYKELHNGALPVMDDSL